MDVIVSFVCLSLTNYLRSNFTTKCLLRFAQYVRISVMIRLFFDQQSKIHKLDLIDMYDARRLTSDLLMHLH